MTRISRVKLSIIAAFVVVSCLLLFTPGTGAASAGATADMGSPRSLYMQNCAGCHGANGKSETKLGRKYNADDISGGVGTGKTIRIVTNGKGHMPSFKRKLTAAQISQIATYLSGL